MLNYSFKETKLTWWVFSFFSPNILTVFNVTDVLDENTLADTTVLSLKTQAESVKAQLQNSRIWSKHARWREPDREFQLLYDPDNRIKQYDPEALTGTTRLLLEQATGDSDGYFTGVSWPNRLANSPIGFH